MVPEESLQRIERDALLLEEVYLGIICLDVFLVQTVDDKYMVGSKLQTANLCTQDRNKELDADDFILAHAQFARHGNILITSLETERHVTYNILGINLIV